MILSEISVRRPVFAMVVSLLLTIIGLMAADRLSVREYPDISAPIVSVDTRYRGATAAVVESKITQIIENQIAGLEGIEKITSSSAEERSRITIEFSLDREIESAANDVRDRVARVQNNLPDEADPPEISKVDANSDPVMHIDIASDQRSVLELNDYTDRYLLDRFSVVQGVALTRINGERRYAMRIWLDRKALAGRQLTVQDVEAALRRENMQLPAGRIESVNREFSLRTDTGFNTEEDFRQLVIGRGVDGSLVKLGEVADVKRDAEDLRSISRSNGVTGISIAIVPTSTANVLDVTRGVKQEMERVRTTLPQDIRMEINVDNSLFVDESINEVIHALGVALVLVLVVIYAFLGTLRATLIPAITIPVSIIASSIVMVMAGFSINVLTLLGAVLAIGLVVDDAIVVLENIERWLDKGLPVREATIQAMNEITGPILAITLVLSSVLLPSAFLGGITGQFFRQFALTISVAMIISAINAMTMTPARAASIFAGRTPGAHGDQGKEALPWWSFALLGGLATVWLLAPTLGAWLGLPVGEEGGEAAPGGLQATVLTWGIYFVLFLPGAVAGGALGWFLIRPVNWVLGKLFRGFNWLFDWTTQAYGKAVGWCLRLSVIVLLIYVGLIGLTGFGFTRVPSGFIPSQDKGTLLVNIQLPDSAALERTVEVTAAVEKITLETPGVMHTASFPGQSIVLNAISSNYGTMFVILAPFEERRGPTLTGEAIAAQLRARFQREIPEARVLVFGRPAVPGLGNAGGFKLMVEATGDVNFDALQAQADILAAKGNQQPGLVGLFNGFRARTPQLYVDIDRTKVKTMGVELTAVFDALQVYLGSSYVNDFNRFGRTWQVNVQADAPFRMDAETVKQLKVRNAAGDMVPLGAVAEVRDSAGPVQITRYNMFPAAAINGASLPGVSTGDVLATMEKLAQELPRNMTTEWTELSYLQKQESQLESFRDLQQNSFSAFVLGTVLVFFVLAGLYESWSLPLAVILVVPMCILSAVAGIALAGMDINIFVQVGFVVLVGLAAKNAILIVEFARDRQQEGVSRFDAAVEAGKVRLRPIIMTSFAFILGVLPLVIAQGAGAEMRRTLGTAVFAGMIGVTLFGIFLTPVFYYVIRWFSERHSSNAPDTAAPQPPAEASIPAPSRRVVSIEHQDSRGTRLQSTSDVLGKSSDRREE